ncbi:ESPR-type extended signal peptide-containing protein [Chitinimonas koreensis]|uniref:ESPR-type extended signal peptide-containing protein n=1 Tax=Chitinimonas koreensis TaxID=356302 RepID=UPI003570CB3D
MHIWSHSQSKLVAVSECTPARGKTGGRAGAQAASDATELPAGARSLPVAPASAARSIR